MNQQRKEPGAGNVVGKCSGTMSEVVGDLFSLAALGIEQLVPSTPGFAAFKGLFLIPLYPGQAGCQICTGERGKHGHFNI